MYLFHILTVVVLLGTWTQSSANTHCWSEWGPWSCCSATCGNGTTTRSRTCDRDASNDDEKYEVDPAKQCYGDCDQHKPCFIQPCQNCSYVNFTSFTPCGLCGGFQYRVGICSCPLPTTSRSVLTPYCQGPQPYEFRICNVSNFCLPSAPVTPPTTPPSVPPVTPTPTPTPTATPTPTPTPTVTPTPPTAPPCAFGVFSDWTQCVSPCVGQRFRRQLCVCAGGSCPLNYNDSLCTGVPIVEVQNCNAIGVPCDCHYEYLSGFTPCSACCGGGTQYRTPTCICNGNTPFPNSYCYLTPPNITVQACNTQACCFYGATLGPQICPTPSDPNSVCAHPYSKFPCLCPDASGNLIVSDDLLCPIPLNRRDISTFPYVVNTSSYCIVYDQVSTSPSGEYFNITTCIELQLNGTCLEFLIRYSPFVGQEGTEQIAIIGYVPRNECSTCYTGFTNFTSCCGNCTAGGSRFRIQTSLDASLCHLPPTVDLENCTVPGCCGYCTTCAPFNCSASCGIGTQYTFPVCLCNDTSLCGPPPITINQVCDLGDCCAFQNGTQTSCGTNLTLFNSQKCVCPESTNSACNIAPCIGVPLYSVSACSLASIAPSIVPSILPIPVPSILPPPSPTPAPSVVPSVIPSPSTFNGSVSSYCVLVISSVSACTGTCTNSPCNGVAIGTQVITRTCICNGLVSNYSLCDSMLPVTQNVGCYLVCPTCQWSPYGPWSECSSPCGCGSKVRARNCSCSASTVITSYHDQYYQPNTPCFGNAIDSSPCNFQDCIVPRDASYWRHHIDDWPISAKFSVFPACSSLTWAQMLEKKGKLNTWEQLASEYIVAELNVMRGVYPTPTTANAINTALTLLGQCVPGPLHHETLEILCGFNSGSDDYVYSSQTGQSQLDVIQNSDSGNMGSSGLTGNAFYLVAYGIPGFVLLVVVVVGMTVVVRRKCVRVDSPVIEQQIV